MTESPGHRAALSDGQHEGPIRLPDFVMLGQGKAGTSLIYRELEGRSDVGLSPRKELHYFNLGFDKGPAARRDYAAQFADIPPGVAVVGEIAPDYLAIETIDRILGTLGPRTKLVVSLRHPVDRAFSRYIQNVAAGQTTQPFRLPPRNLAQRLDALFDVLDHLFTVVPASQRLILQYERDIVGRHPAYRRKLAEFLGLAPDWPPEATLRDRINAGVMPRYLWSGDTPLDVRQMRKSYRIPARTLVFCAQSRNSKIWRNASEAEVAAALARQSRWTPCLEAAQYRQFQERAVLPAAERLEAAFGFDLSHWRGRPKRLQYPLAPPPDAFEVTAGAVPAQDESAP